MVRLTFTTRFVIAYIYFGNLSGNFFTVFAFDTNQSVTDSELCEKLFASSRTKNSKDSHQYPSHCNAENRQTFYIEHKPKGKENLYSKQKNQYNYISGEISKTNDFINQKIEQTINILDTPEERIQEKENIFETLQKLLNKNLPGRSQIHHDLKNINSKKINEKVYDLTLISNMLEEFSKNASVFHRVTLNLFTFMTEDYYKFICENTKEGHNKIKIRIITEVFNHYLERLNEMIINTQNIFLLYNDPNKLLNKLKTGNQILKEKDFFKELTMRQKCEDLSKEYFNNDKNTIQTVIGKLEISLFDKAPISNIKGISEKYQINEKHGNNSINIISNFQEIINGFEALTELFTTDYKNKEIMDNFNNNEIEEINTIKDKIDICQKIIEIFRHYIRYFETEWKFDYIVGLFSKIQRKEVKTKNKNKNIYYLADEIRKIDNSESYY